MKLLYIYTYHANDQVSILRITLMHSAEVYKDWRREVHVYTLWDSLLKIRQAHIDKQIAG